MPLRKCDRYQREGTMSVDAGKCLTYCVFLPKEVRCFHKESIKDNILCQKIFGLNFEWQMARKPTSSWFI